MNVLFVCTMGQLRSRTAAHLFDGKNGIVAKHCGTDFVGAAVGLNDKLVRWADVIICMKSTHARKVSKFKIPRPVHVVNINDEYDYMQPELVRLLQERVPAVLGCGR